MAHDPCRVCGEELYPVKGLHHDREGIREDRWCETCKVMYSCHASGLQKRLVLKDVYEGASKEKIERLLTRALAELRTKKQGG